MGQKKPLKMSYKTFFKDDKVEDNKPEDNNSENSNINNKSKMESIPQDITTDEELFKKKTLEKLMSDKKLLLQQIREEKEKIGVTKNVKNIKNEEQIIKEQKSLDLMSRAVSKFLIIPLKIVCKRIDKDNPLTEEEKEEFLDASKMMIEKYAEWILTYSVEINFAFVLSSIVITRIYEKVEKDIITEKVE